MSEVLDLVRPELRDFAGYASARRTQANGSVWLNANESPQPSLADSGLALNRYPEPQPLKLRERMAGLYGVRTPQLLVTRGSDEGIDLLVRALCRAGQDAVLIAPPCFGMYAVCARVQNAKLVEVPLDDVDGTWSLNLERVLAAVVEYRVHVIFLCSPGNPTGHALSLAQIRGLLDALQGRALVAIDEAYVEYSSIASACSLLDDYPCLAVLRTLSKAHALAGARVGAVMADPLLITVLGNISAPYPVPSPSAAVAWAALGQPALEQSTLRCRVAIEQREALFAALADSGLCKRIYRSEGNYLLVRFDDAELAFRRLLAAGVVVRDMRSTPMLGDALRISIGTPEENRLMLDALRAESPA